MNDLEKAARMALEAICGSGDFLFNWHDCEPNNEREMQAYQAALAANEQAFTALRQALDQPAQEPVDWEAVAADQAMTIAMMKAERKPWVALTDEERRGIPEWQKIQEELGPVWAPMMLYLYLAIEAKLREKNAGGQA